MDGVPADLESAIERHQAGDLASAESMYRRVLQANPEHWDTVYLLGTALLQMGRFEDCIEQLDRVVVERPDVPDAHNNLGVAYKALGRWEESARAFQAALKANPDYDQALFNLGALMIDRKLFADAEKCYRHASDVNPDDVQTRYGLGNALKAQNKWSEAEACYREVLAQDPQNLDVQVNLGFVLTRQEQLTEAADIYRQILKVKPNFHEVHNNLSFVFERQGRLDDAIGSARKAIEISPKFADGYNNLGTALRSRHRLDEACECFQKALAINPDSALAEFNYGTTRLLQGDFQNGWRGYDRRAAALDMPSRQFQQPQWEGERIEGKTLFVHADQGFGDAIQFVRFLKQAKQRSGARVVFECQSELNRLFSGQPDIDEFIVDGEPLPVFDSHISLSSLARLFEVDVDTIPDGVPYIESRASLKTELRRLIEAADPAYLKVGIVWQGNPEQARDIVRSCSLEEFAPLTDVEGVSLLSLQTGQIGLEQLSRLAAGGNIVDLGSLFHDFADTAAALSQIDLVVTVDTAVAHLAGALGCEVWTLLAHTPDWRWLLGRTDSPWYPTMKLFRQPKWGDWDSVMKSVAQALRLLVREQRA